MSAPNPAPPPAPKPASLPQLPIEDSQGLSTESIKFIYWGDQGTGKTYNILTWPGVFVVCFDPHFRTINDHPCRVPVIRIDNPEKLPIFHGQFLTAVKNRQLSELVAAMGFPGYKVRTVALDSLTFYGEHLDRVFGKQHEGEKNKFARWDAYRWRFIDTFSVLETAGGPLPGKEAYHLVSSVHEKIVTDKEGAVKAILPSLDGQFAEKLFKRTDAVLLCNKRVENKGPNQFNTVYECTTVPTDQFRKLKDTVGGGQRFRPLPPKVSGDFPSLAKAWGLPPEMYTTTNS